MELLLKYFPDLTDQQRDQFARLPELYRHWNSQINVISRRDIDHLTERHVLHALAVAKAVPFKPFTEVMDLGTGGGMPGLPLAILFPRARFTLVDSIGKKVKVATDIAQQLGLENVALHHGRAEQVEGPFEFVVSRAVAPMGKLIGWTRGKFVRHYQHELPNGLLCLKGGDLRAELLGLNRVKVFEISRWFEEDFFAEKKIVYFPMVKR